jgi:hypothetical protein
METGFVTLTNSKRYPFNDSRQTVPLETERADAGYTVTAEIESADGDAGDIVVSLKAINGFKLEFTGSATCVGVRYAVLG